jgi:antitoxin MazE
MRTYLRRIGNSCGIIIPATLLETCELGEEVNLRIEGKTLIVEALNVPRKNWFAGYKVEEDTDEWQSFPVNDDNSEWKW